MRLDEEGVNSSFDDEDEAGGMANGGGGRVTFQLGKQDTLWQGAGGSTIVHSSAGSDSSDNGGGGRLCGAYGTIRTARMMNRAWQFAEGGGTIRRAKGAQAGRREESRPGNARNATTRLTTSVTSSILN